MTEFVYTVQDGRYYDVMDSASNLLTMMTRKQVATGEQSDFSALKKSLTEERTRLAAGMGSAQGSIVSEKAGYFVLNVDGFENKLSTTDLESLTPEKLKDLRADSVSKDVVGKIVYDYRWYLAATVSLSDSMHYKVGQTVTIKTDTTASPKITATVERINLSKSGNDAVLILMVSEMNSEIASMRTGSITIIKNEYEGIKVKNTALRVIDGVTGVFVVTGMEAKFVAIDIIYSTEDYTICSLNTSDSSKLRLYDEIVVKGKNLYDGKIIY